MKKNITILVLLTLLQGCSDFNEFFKNFGKSDINMVTNINIKELNKYIEKLTIKLYEKNPQELAKNPDISIESRLVQILEYPNSIAYKELDYQQSTKAIELALDHDYDGDRVFSLMLGISSMLRFSYNNRSEMYLLNKLDPQKLYDSARNLERIAQRLRIESEHGQALLVLDSVYGKNSFENLLSRMVSAQDIMARIIAGKTDRVINQVIQGAATALIPIPI